MDIYVDVLLFENITMNYLIIWLTSKTIKAEARKSKMVAASVVGAFYALFLFIPGYKVLYSMVMKVLLSFLMMVIAFTPSRVREFVKQLSVFYLISFVLGGAVFGLFYFTNNGLPLTNGIFFIRGVSPLILLGAGVLTLIFVRLCVIPLYNLLDKKALQIDFSIYFEGSKINLTGLVDTGNTLYDPITNYPVIVVQYSAIRDIIPGNIKNLFENGCEINLEDIYERVKEAGWISRLRLIPYSSLGRDKGMMLGFKADKVVIKDRGFKEVIIAVYAKSLSKNQEYEALLNPDLLR